MEIDLENLSKQQLLKLLTKAQKTISKQESELEKEKEKTAELERLVKLLQRMKFGQSRERFEDPNQTQLPLDVQPEVLEEQEEVIKQEITSSCSCITSGSTSKGELTREANLFFDTIS